MLIAIQQVVPQQIAAALSTKPHLLLVPDRLLTVTQQDVHQQIAVVRYQNQVVAAVLVLPYLVAMKQILVTLEAAEL